MKCLASATENVFNYETFKKPGKTITGNNSGIFFVISS